jgi:hypothetical protein
MATLFDKIKRCLGFYPKATYYRIEQNTGEPIKVEYTPEEPAVSEQPQEEVAVDNKDDGIDLAAMTKAQLLELATARGISTVSMKNKKQEIIDALNSSPG